MIYDSVQIVSGACIESDWENLGRVDFQRSLKDAHVVVEITQAFGTSDSFSVVPVLERSRVEVFQMCEGTLKEVWNVILVSHAGNCQNHAQIYRRWSWFKKSNQILILMSQRGIPAEQLTKNRKWKKEMHGHPLLGLVARLTERYLWAYGFL